MFAKGRFAVSLYSRKYFYLTHNSSDFHLIYLLYEDMCTEDSRFHQLTCGIFSFGTALLQTSCKNTPTYNSK